jgi:23S rRNA (uracil1939-C5)-methyltransferase
VEVRVESLAAGGDGVARLPDGLTIFIPFTAPGDRARICVTERRKRFARGRVSELLEGGKSRVIPRCPFFGRCGGCSWQHVDYGEQVVAKRRILREALARIGGFAPPDHIPLTPSPRAYSYRMRARLFVEDGRVGYRQRASHSLCSIDQCPILVPELEAELVRLGQCLATESRGSEEWEICAGMDGALRSSRLSSAADPRRPAENIEIRVGEDALSISVGTFVQANRPLHDPLRAAVLRAAGRGGRLVELHAGAGFFTLDLARHFSRVEAVEASPVAAADLKANLAGAGLGNVRVLAAAIEEVVPEQLENEPEVILLDPPRSGLPSAMPSALSALGARRIVYLSCDPATLSRDLARLMDLGYALERVEGFDLFPQTPHVEALAVLKWD